MAYQVKISTHAEKDILTAKCFYRISGLEKDFDTDFIGQIEYFKNNPFLFQVYYRNVRRLHFHNFNYSMHYLVKGENVYILRILHHKQDHK